MPSFCGVINCGARSGRDNERWFRVPMISRLPNKVALTTKRQKAWIDALKRTGLNPATYNNLRVCSKHFLSGRYIQDKKQKNIILFIYFFCLKANQLP